ncbi:MAG: potassium channel family protein [Candidatus Aminicenantales bacterium]
MESKKRIFLSLAVFVLVFIIGVVGFKILGGPEWSLLDSLYMTVITLSTVGYEEVVDISANPGARVFATVFIILCLGTIAFAVSSITSFIVEGELKNVLGRKRMEKEISRLKDHYIVCGSDETAQTIIQELLLTKKKFVVIEPLKEKVDKLSSKGEILLIHGDPTEDNVLLQAGIEKARGILLSLPTDEANLFVTLTARSLNPEIRIVTKGIDVKSHKKMVKAGADAVISPTFIGGMRMVSEMIRPAVVTFLDMMLRERERVLRFEELKVGKESSLVGKTLAEAKLGEKTDALLVAIRQEGRKDYEFNPSEDAVIKENDTLILIASPEAVRDLEELAS